MKSTVVAAAVFALIVLAGMLCPIAQADKGEGASGQSLFLAENVDKCTDRYNYCVASCARYQDECTKNGNDAEYCKGQYTSCQNDCENRMKQCWSE